jgi:hypothetical protein
MPTDNLRVRLDGPSPQGWRILWLQAQREGDTKKLHTIIETVNRMLTEQENRSVESAKREKSACDLIPKAPLHLSKFDNSIGTDYGEGERSLPFTLSDSLN